MQPPHPHSWTSPAELKGQLIRKLGPERSKQYFDYLNRFLSLKLSKAEYYKLCLRTVGKDNLPLHNQLIRSILKNACSGKVQLPTLDSPLRTVGNKKSSDGVYHQNGSIPVVSQGASPLALPNGDILPPSPRKTRTGARERRGGDRRSALGPNGKTSYSSPSSSIPHSEDFSTALENGTSSSLDTRRPLQHHQELMQLAENGQTESLGRKGGKEVSGRISLHAPLGIPYCPMSIGGARRTLPSASSSKCVSVVDNDCLLETITLRERMEQIAATQGLQGVSMDCANLLNNGVDAYLKGLIRSCAELNGARSGHEPMKSNSVKHQAHLRPLNGVRPSHHYQIQSGSWPLDTMIEQEPRHPIPLLDFRVAMDLNPQQLGEDWPILLEKICTHAFEE